MIEKRIIKSLIIEKQEEISDVSLVKKLADIKQ
jgi:hypothetical protein